jgi:hypothetical protein
MKVHTGLVSDDMIMHNELLGTEVKCLGGDPRHPEGGHMSG